MLGPHEAVSSLSSSLSLSAAMRRGGAKSEQCCGHEDDQKARKEGRSQRTYVFASKVFTCPMPTLPKFRPQFLPRMKQSIYKEPKRLLCSPTPPHTHTHTTLPIPSMTSITNSSETKDSFNTFKNSTLVSGDAHSTTSHSLATITNSVVNFITVMPAGGGKSFPRRLNERLRLMVWILGHGGAGPLSAGSESTIGEGGGGGGGGDHTLTGTSASTSSGGKWTCFSLETLLTFWLYYHEGLPMRFRTPSTRLETVHEPDDGGPSLLQGAYDPSQSGRASLSSGTAGTSDKISLHFNDMPNGPRGQVLSDSFRMCIGGLERLIRFFAYRTI